MNWSVALPPASNGAGSNIGDPNPIDEKVLLQAFRSFAKVAGSLERSYGMLQLEVERLRRELVEKDGDLAKSLAEKRSERARVSRILDGLPCGVLVVLDLEKIWKANSEALHLLQTGPLPNRLTSISALPAQLRQWLTCVQKEGGEREIERPQPSGPPRWVAARHASRGEGISVFILRDVTEHKCLEETRAKLHRDEALAQMAAILAHEVRNPLGSLELFAGLLADSGLQGEQQQWIDYMQAGLRTLAATVNNVLHFHSMSGPEFSAVDVGQLLEWVLNFCSPLARRSGVTLSLQNRMAGIAMRGDRHQLEQVLLNLVLNSMRAISDGGWIELAGRPSADGRQLELAVSDTGRGIPADCVSRIFEPGFSTRAGSPGLGLAVCRKLVEQHGGSIHAESSSERGTTFRVKFPLAQEAQS